MKLHGAATLVLSTTLISCQAGNIGVSTAPSSEEDKTFYAIGAMFGSRLKELELTEPEAKMVVSGVYDSVLKNKLQVTLADYSPKVQGLFRQRMTARADVEKKRGVEFLEKFIKDEGAQKTPSGLVYKIIQQGKGPKPSSTDIVEVHYTGTLIDGTTFDSSRKRDKPTSFPLNRVIKGWTEGIQLISKGGKVKLVIPSDLAYGDSGSPPRIPAGATLIFDVELLAIKPPPKEGSKKGNKRSTGKKKPRKK